jgi:hypothetical protein
MSAVNDGGPAFPVVVPPTEKGATGFLDDRIEAGEMAIYSGMSIRDYFAAKAMQGVLAQSRGTALGSDPKFCAQYAYAMADAMLKARGS